MIRPVPGHAHAATFVVVSGAGRSSTRAGVEGGGHHAAVQHTTQAPIAVLRLKIEDDATDDPKTHTPPEREATQTKLSLSAAFGWVRSQGLLAFAPLVIPQWPGNIIICVAVVIALLASGVRLRYRTQMFIIFQVLPVLFARLGYEFVRNRFGSNGISPSVAFANSKLLIDIEDHFGLYFERELQSLFLPFPKFMVVLNTFYVGAHFGVAISVLVVILIKSREKYIKWSRIFFLVCVCALIGFGSFPVMPPRLLARCDDPLGACRPEYNGHVDSLAKFPGPLNWNSSVMKGTGNQYAAMPSVHTSWATLAVFAELDSRALPGPMRRALMFHPFVTLFAIIVTGNHFWLDAVGGLVSVYVAIGMYHSIARLWKLVFPEGLIPAAAV